MTFRPFLALILLSALACASAEEPVLAPGEAVVEVQFYFSKKDPDLAERDKALAAVVKQFPMIRIDRICIDEKPGYAKLQALEKQFDITKPGDATIAFGPYYLLSKGDQRDIELYFGAMMKRLIGQMKGDNTFKARLTPNIPLYTQTVFGKDAVATIEPDQKGKAIMYYRVMKDGKFAGWIADAYDPIMCPVCNGAQFLLSTNPSLSIMDVSPVRNIERLGTKIPDEEIAKFVSQFKGKTPAKPIEKIDAVSRATKTSKAFVVAVNEVMADLKKRTEKK